MHTKYLIKKKKQGTKLFLSKENECIKLISGFMTQKIIILRYDQKNHFILKYTPPRMFFHT